MATNRTRRTRKMTPGISENMRRYLLTGECEKGDIEIFMTTDKEMRTAWDRCRDDIMGAWIKNAPGTRPYMWWECDGPKQDTGTGAYFEPLPIPRERIGGKGKTTCEVYPAVVPRFEKGIPSSWAEIDDDNPPTFEAEATYLKRHGLLIETEEKHLKKANFKHEKVIC